MRVVHSTRDQAIVASSPIPQAAIGLLLVAAAAGVARLATQDGGPGWPLLLLAFFFGGVGALLVGSAAGATVAVDRGERRVVLTQRRLLGRAQRRSFPLDEVADAALERPARGSGDTARPVLVLTSGERVPWWSVYRNDVASQARGVAALRMAARWDALPATAALAPLSAERAASARESTRSSLGCLAVGGGLFALVGLGVMAVQLYRVATYRPVPADVYETHVGSSTSGGRGGTTYRPVVRYRFTAGGGEYQSERVFPVTYSRGGGWGARWAEEVIGRFPSGSRVTAYASPRDPTSAFLVREVSLLPLVLVVFPLALGAGIRALARRDERLRAPAGGVPLVPVLQFAHPAQEPADALARVSPRPEQAGGR